MSEYMLNARKSIKNYVRRIMNFEKVENMKLVLYANKCINITDFIILFVRILVGYRFNKFRE